MGVFGGGSYPHDLCLPGKHLVDALVDGASMLGGGYALYVVPARWSASASLPVVPPALRGTGGPPPPGPGGAGAERVWVVLALDPGQEQVLLRGGG